MSRGRLFIAALAAVAVIAGLMGFFLSRLIQPQSIPARPTPVPSVRPTGNAFPVTSAVIRDKAGINVEPGMRPWVFYGPNPDGWWCEPPNCYQQRRPLQVIDKEMALMARLDVGLVRLEFPWPLIESAPGVYTWSRADYIVRQADRYGLQLQPILDFTPSWAGPSPAASPIRRRSWPDFVAKMVHRYKNSVHYWEMWNEPDGGHYWIDGEQKYVRNILIPGYRAVKLEDQSAKVLLGAPYFADEAYLNGIFTYGGGKSFDITGFHDYSNVLSPAGVQGDVQLAQSVLNRYGQGKKPIWIGEYGFAEPSDTTNDANQVAAIRIMLRHVSGYQVASWYNLRDDMAVSCCPPQAVKSAYWGLVQHDDSTRKQGYEVMKQAVGHVRNGVVG
jgi:hypothetical protein